MEPSASAPQAIVRTRARPSIVWLIPLIAAAVGLYLAYWAWSEQGPTVTIIFTCLVGGLWPAWRAARMRPADAVRHV